MIRGEDFNQKLSLSYLGFSLPTSQCAKQKMKLQQDLLLTTHTGTCFGLDLLLHYCTFTEAVAREMYAPAKSTTAESLIQNHKK